LHINEPGQTLDQDADQLRALGYESRFERSMSKWENYSLGFTYLSPVLGVYTIFASGFLAGGPPAVNGSYWPAFLASSLAAMFCYYGFEACGDVAEETPNASRMIPKAMRMTIYIGGAAATWVCLAFVLSIPDIGAVMSGKDKDPIVTVLTAAVGETGFRAVIVVVLVSFISCLLQAAASRLIHAYARDQMIFGSKYLSRMSPQRHVPATALVSMGAIPALIALCALWLQDAIATIISFAAIGIYVAFQMIVLGALIARGEGWRPAGPFTLGAWGWLVNVIALAYGVGAIINMSWPHSPADPWYLDYAMILTTLAVLVLGLIYMLLARPYAHGNAPAGDAHRVSQRMEYR
jgi:amino acid transporter